MASLTFYNAVRLAFRSKAIYPVLGHTTLLLWRSQEHYNHWSKIPKFTSDVEQFTVPTQLLPIPILPKQDHSKMAFVGIVFAKKPNYTDAMLKYYVAAEKE